MAERRRIELLVNGRSYSANIDPRTTLVDVLRDELGLTGTHIGCEQGACGACTVLMDGATVRSCLLLAIQAEGHSLCTVEGLTGDNGDLHPVQEAFAVEGAFQCGFCTPGFLLTAVEYLDEVAHPTEAEVRERLTGNLCRCTGYERIVAAVLRAAGFTQDGCSPGGPARPRHDAP